MTTTQGSDRILRKVQGTDDVEEGWSTHPGGGEKAFLSDSKSELNLKKWAGWAVWEGGWGQTLVWRASCESNGREGQTRWSHSSAHPGGWLPLLLFLDILVASGLSANIVRVHVWTFLRFLSYIRENSRDLSPLCVLFSFLFPPKCPLPLSYLWQGPGIIEQSGNKGCGHSITCVWWVSGGPYTCIWLNCGDQWPSATYQGSKFLTCSDALLSYGTSVLPLCPY